MLPRSLVPALVLLLLPTVAATAEVRETLCTVDRVLVIEDRIEITCADPTELGDRGRDGLREIQRFAYPLVSQSLEVHFGSQVNLVDYHLSQMQTAVAHDVPLRIWFDTDPGRASLYGCEEEACRPFIALALERRALP